MTAKQLALEPPPPPTPRKEATYRMVRVTASDCNDASQRGRVALQTYTGKPKPPAWIICHAEDAAAIGAEIEGVPVIATGKARDLVPLGPIDL